MLWKVVDGRRWLVANGLFVKGSWRLAVMVWEAVVMSGFLLLKCLAWNSLFYGGSNDNRACCGRLLAVEGGWWQMNWLLKAAGGWRECCGRWLVMSGVVVKLYSVRWPLMVLLMVLGQVVEGCWC